MSAKRGGGASGLGGSNGTYNGVKLPTPLAGSDVIDLDNLGNLSGSPSDVAAANDIRNEFVDYAMAEAVSDALTYSTSVDSMKEYIDLNVADRAKSYGAASKTSATKEAVEKINQDKATYNNFVAHIKQHTDAKYWLKHKRDVRKLAWSMRADTKRGTRFV